MRQNGTKFCQNRKFELKKSFELYRQFIVKGLNKIWLKFCPFCANELNEMKSSIHACSKMLYSPNLIDRLILMSIVTLSITMLFHYAECHYVVCPILIIVVLNDIMLNVVMPSVVMLNVVAPSKQAEVVIVMSTIDPQMMKRPGL
jgi:hypothetical protein